MDKKDFYDLEDQIMNTVKNAINAIDFASLKKDIGDKADDTLDEVKAKLKEYNKKIEEKKYTNLNKINKNKNKNKVSMYIDKKPVGSVSGILYIVFGVIGSVSFGVLLILYSMWTSIFSEFLKNSFIGLGVLFAFFATSVGFSLKGVSLRKRVKRFKQYVRVIDNKGYCLIQDLATFINEKNKFVLKDLRKMIDLGMFKQGHIDEEKTYFMLSDEVYENYLNLKLQKASKEKLKQQEEVNEEISDPKKEEFKAIIKMGKNYIEEIKTVKNELYKEQFSLKLDKLQRIISEILNYIEKNPKKLQEVDKFINHYLPITMKLINSYKELNNQPVQGDNIKAAKNEIEKSIDLINSAFENLLDDLFEDIALDISTDISVLKTLFKQEGLTENDFEK